MYGILFVPFWVFNLYKKRQVKEHCNNEQKLKKEVIISTMERCSLQHICLTIHIVTFLASLLMYYKMIFKISTFTAKCTTLYHASLNCVSDQDCVVWSYVKGPCSWVNVHNDQAVFFKSSCNNVNSHLPKQSLLLLKIATSLSFTL